MKIKDLFCIFLLTASYCYNTSIALIQAELCNKY